jgi:hypothetical protein
LSPIHIRNGDEWTSIDFVLSTNPNKVNIVDSSRIYQIIQKDPQAKDKILDLLSKWDYYKLDIYKKKLDLSEHFVKYSINCKNQAYRWLRNNGNANNIWIISQHIHEKITNTPTIPWSSIKGMIRSALFYRYTQQQDITIANFNEKSIEEEIYKIVKWLVVSDVKIEDYGLSIQKVNVQWVKKNNNIPTYKMTIDAWKFEIQIKDPFWSLPSSFHEIMRKYSALIISREKKIFDNFEDEAINKNVLREIYDLYKDKNMMPMKIGMYKKSLTYTNYREDMIRNKRYMKQVWNKSLWIDENRIPMWRIVLSTI